MSMFWDESIIIEYSPFCLYTRTGILFEVVDDYYDNRADIHYAHLRIIKNDKVIQRSVDWVHENCTTLTEMEVIAWASK